MTTHDYVFISFTLLMALLLSLSRLTTMKRSCSNDNSSVKISSEFSAEFLKLFKPLIIFSVVIAVIAMFKSMQVGLNAFFGLLMVSLVIAFSFSFYKVFRGGARVYTLPLVVIYAVFLITYIFKLFMRANAL